MLFGADKIVDILYGVYFMELCLKRVNNIQNLSVEKLIREACDNFYFNRDYEQALEEINKALTLQPENVKALVLKGNILFCLDMDKDALECFDKAINYNPLSAEAYGSKAGILDILGQPIEALKCCNKAFELIRRHNNYLLSSLFDQKLTLLLRYRRCEEAKKTLQRAMQMLPLEEAGYLCACYQGLIESSCRLRKRKLEQAKRLSLKVV